MIGQTASMLFVCFGPGTFHIVDDSLVRLAASKYGVCGVTR